MTNHPNRRKPSIIKTDWPSITDVPCPMPRCTGTLRWAEAGYAPGYRICDGHRHHHFALRDDRLTYTGRCEPQSPAAAASDRNAVRSAAVERARASGAKAALDSVYEWGIHISGYQPSLTEVDQAYTAAYRAEMVARSPDLWATAHEIQAILPRVVSLLALTRDGRVMLYRHTRDGRPWGGTSVTTLDAIRAHPEARGEDYWSAEDYERVVGATPGYIG